MDIGGWLRSLGLQQYEAIFRDNAIDETVLPDLTIRIWRSLLTLVLLDRTMPRAEGAKAFV